MNIWLFISFSLYKDLVALNDVLTDDEGKQKRISPSFQVFAFIIRIDAGPPPGALERPFGPIFAILALFALWRQMEVPTYFFRRVDRFLASYGHLKARPGHPTPGSRWSIKMTAARRSQNNCLFYLRG